MSLLPLLLLSAMAPRRDIAQDVADLARDHVNVALRDWGYSHASASSVYQPGYEADNAIDGKWASRETDKWNSAKGPGPHWLIVDMGHPFTVDAIVLRHEGVFAEGNLYNTSDFSVQRSDAASGPWSDFLPPVHGNRDNISLLRFPPVRTRYVRIFIEKGEQNANEFGRLFEVEVYSPKDQADVPMIRLAWPATPTYRRVDGRLESAAEIHPLHPTSALTYLVNGRRQAAMDGRLWLPIDGNRPASVSLESQSAPSPRWSMTDDRAWMTGMEGGAIHLLSSSHQDVAWMDTPDWCRVHRVSEILEPAIDMMLRDHRYHFTMENMLNLFELLQERPGRRDEIERLIRNGQLEFGGTYNQPYESLLGGEQLVRQVYFGRRWLRKQFPGTDTCIAYTVDVPGRSLQMQQILAKAGIKYLVTSRYHEGLFRWFAPDGSSILVYALPHYGNDSGVLKEEPAAAVRDLPKLLRTVARDFPKQKLPPHYMVLNSQDFESPVDFGPLLTAWTKQAPIATVDGKPVSPPTLDYSSTTGLFQSLDTPSAKPKELMGERPNMWLYIHGPTHHEAIQAQREAARLLPAAETFATMSSLVDGNFSHYPFEKLSNAWLDSLYPDHGFGGKNGHITDGVYHAKFAGARAAAADSLSVSLPALASHIKADRSRGVPVVVFNPHSWTRSDAVSIEAPSSGTDWRVLDSGGKDVACQIRSMPDRTNVAAVTLGARIAQATGKDADRLLDGDWWDARKSHWEAPVSAGVPASVVIDLGQIRQVERILVRHYGSLGEFQNESRFNTRSFRLSGAIDSNGVWTEMVPTVQGNERPISAFEFAPIGLRFVRLEILEPNIGVDQTARVLGIEVFARIASTRSTVRFHASSVPSLGYRTFYLVKGTGADLQPAVKDGETGVENGFYRVQLAEGGIASILDKQAHRELLRKSGLAAGEVLTLSSVGNGAGEFGAVQQPTMDGFDRTSAHHPAWKRVAERSGSLCTTYELVQPLGGATIRQRLVVYHQIKRIDLDVDMEGWVGEKYRDYRLALPLGGPKAKVSYEVPMGTVRVGENEVKATGGWAYGSLNYWQNCSDIHPREVQDFIRVEDGGLTTTVSTSVCVFDFVDPTGLGGVGPLIQPILLASRKSCHGEGNWYLQPGDHHFHFSISSSASRDEGWRDAADAQLPMMAVLANPGRSDLPETLSFASVDRPNVRISTIKKAEDDDSVVVRCYEVDGRPVEAKFSIFGNPSSAALCNLIEDEQRSLPTPAGHISMHVGKYAIETVKVRVRI
ncbi:MAG: discoidin domain-containing protein [Fimbriimonas sp.]|nr:discoidin domain-containing protein [Fimbriimonas sp.]